MPTDETDNPANPANPAADPAANQAANRADADPIAALSRTVRFGPSQVWGQVRVVPLLRDDPIVDLRLSPMAYDTDIAIVRTAPRTSYIGYAPHAIVADWTRDGSPAAAFGTQLIEGTDPERNPAIRCMSLRFQRRMARRIGKDRVRFLPSNLALEGYLSLHFGGPTIAWEEWCRRAINKGLSPRVEAAYVGAIVPGLADALKIFELHPRQCGVLLYVADELASVLLTPHPEDYRALHPTLLNDLYGEVIYQYGAASTRAPELRVRLDERAVRGLADLRTEAERAIAETARYHRGVAEIEISDGETFSHRTIRRMGRFRLGRFLPSFRRAAPGHIGELITGDDGEIAYLKTFRLSVAQVKRGFLLSLLAEHDWNLQAAGASIGASAAEIGTRLEASGFGHLLRPDVLDRFRRTDGSTVGGWR